jgi:diguanylate cyclase (GGDEF)-like protein
VVQSGSKSLWVSTLYEKPLRIGDVADITGFPDVKNGSLILTNGDIQDTYLRAPVVPRNLTPAELALGGHASDLVSVEGKVLMSIREAVQDEYVLVSDGHLFSAIYRHPERGLDLPTPPMKEIKENSIVRMTGICMLDNGDKFQGQVAFNILLRSSNDVAVVARPSLLNVANLSILVGWLLLIVFGVGTRGWLIERRVRRQTASLAKVEEWRRRILEDINASRPLTEILEQIYELASFRLSGALCWCELSDGARVGNCPPRFAELRVVQIQIAARSGPSHGMISAAFDPSSKPRAVELEALSMAAELTTLAIETRRLYTDLLRRSEFDQLTDIHNRFSLDKHLDALIDDARQRGGVFGLIYVDLDKFKQVNDLYGHQIGDLYLQEVAFRMKLQIRPTDILARLGGDEFAALVTHVRTHADVQEIALRIQRSFADPFEIENLLLHGSASMGVALYPDDGVTKDRLLNAADADMYAVKRIRRQDAATFARD